MKTNKLITLLFATLVINVKLFGQEPLSEFPIMAYYGVNPEYASEGQFQAFVNCGFNISHYPFSSAEQFLKVSKIAEKYNVKLMLQTNSLLSDTEKTVKKVMNSGSLYAYHIADEPSYTTLDDLNAKYVDKISKIDKKHSCYINLLPYYDDSMLKKNIKASSYFEYVSKASKINTPQISFDYYPIKTNEFRSTWFENLEIIRNVSITSGKPFWGFVLSVPHVKYPKPTLSMLRLQIYANLAYGAKGIQYFTYWTPKSPNYDFHDAPVSADGKFTTTYNVVKQMNQELKGLCSIFKDGTITSVNHLGQIPNATHELKSMPLNIKSLNVSGGRGAIVSQLKYNNKHYLIMVNKSYESKISIKIKSSNSSAVYLDKSLSAHKLSSKYNLSAGDMIIFRLD